MQLPYHIILIFSWFSSILKLNVLHRIFYFLFNLFSYPSPNAHISKPCTSHAEFLSSLYVCENVRLDWPFHSSTNCRGAWALPVTYYIMEPNSVRLVTFLFTQKLHLVRAKTYYFTACSSIVTQRDTF